MSQSQEAVRAAGLVEEQNRTAPEGALRVGVLTPLGPPGDPVAGELCVRGAVLGARYAQEHQVGPGVRLFLANDQVGADVEHMSRTAVGGLGKLAHLDRISALVGQWHLRTTPAVADVADEIGIPTFIENGHNTVNHGRRHIFRTYFSIADRAPLMASFVREQGWKRIALVAADTVFGQMLADTLEEALRETVPGAEVLRIDFEQDGVTDLDPQLRTVAEFAPDLLLNAAVVRTNYMVIASAVAAGVLPGVPMMACFPFPMRAQDYWRLAGEAGAGVVWPATRFGPDWPGLSPVGRWFVENYEKEFGGAPPDNCLNAFTDVVVLAQAAARGGTGREELQRALETGTFDTWRGPVSFDWSDAKGHHDSPEIVLMHYRKQGDSAQDAVVVWPEEAVTGRYETPARRQK
ncbi:MULTISPECIES: ABC transporter substrate-binding protein [unclassified Streptomyces]|uniref:ABC transporter substrate-binding protein n=1 Tax=unclassified Streptomyces TaxID=2593676 RepID=UPI000BF590A7|nr:ABC transporter substrate-binding protein [Streptomyces sp. Ru87]PGH48093.1 branched-chain amino acid ABC transporter substrate-binding protein [Streptomyces sp. Ru87]